MYFLNSLFFSISIACAPEWPCLQSASIGWIISVTGRLTRPFHVWSWRRFCHVTHCWEADHSIDLSPACQTQERNIHPFCWLEVASLLINSSIICPKPNASIYLSPLFFRVQKIRIFSLALSNKFPIGLQLYLARINSILNCNKLGHLSNRDFVAGLSHNAWWVLWFRKEKWRNGWISSVSF
jgi:hypothetical protein